MGGAASVRSPPATGGGWARTGRCTRAVAGSVVPGQAVEVVMTGTLRPRNGARAADRESVDNYSEPGPGFKARTWAHLDPPPPPPVPNSGPGPAAP